jgi:heme exporter protein A
VVGIHWIEVRRVTRLFGATAALRGVSTRIDAGAITFLTGANGAGKSTLLAIIGTLLSPSSGSVWYEPVGTDREYVRRFLGWVGHESQCYPELSGKQNAELAARLHGVDPVRGWSEVVDRVGAASFAERRLGTLSRGQRQRVALARALIHRPSVLLLDEPWSGLDKSSGERLAQVLLEEKQRGALIVVVSHALEWIERLGGRRVELENGRIVVSPPAEFR